MGYSCSLAFDPTSGDPCIAYYDSTNRDLKYAHWVPDTTTPTTTTTTTTTTIVCQCSPDTTPPAGRISGKVTKNGVGLGNKTVRARRTSPSPEVTKTATTDNDGCYRISDLQDGTYRVRVLDCTGGDTRTVVISDGSKENGMDFTCN